MPDARTEPSEEELPLPPAAPSPSFASSRAAGSTAPVGAAGSRGIESWSHAAPVYADETSARRGVKVRLGAGLIALAVAVVVAWAVPLPEIPLCAFKALTGRPCPGCGMTRSVVSLLRGNVVASLRFHPLGIVLVGALVAGTAGALAGVVGRRDRAWEWFDVKGAKAAIAFGAALVLLWLLRGFVVPSWSPDPIGTYGFPWMPR